MKTRYANILMTVAIPLAGLLLVVAASCSKQPGDESVEPTVTEAVEVTTAAVAPAAVNAQRIINADQEPGNWMSHGRTYDEQRFSPLQAIHDGNAERLGLSWYFDIPTKRGMQATPLMIDGILYVSGSWSRVYAFDATSGELLWQYDPGVPREKLLELCCDAINRGVAAWDGKIFVGTLDGRLVALDAADGSVAWQAQTTPEGSAYSITGAPRVVKGKVIIGNGGSEFGMRGYVSAYDAATGAMAWRFYTVPGDPSQPFENPILEMAAKTWTGEWWKLGGGGTVWDSMAYDAELDLLYIGVGNGSPWNAQIRSPDGGDNLFLSSIVALRPDTGEYVWHYQETPRESWDFTATQHMILADIEVGGRQRKVIMQAPKNGFFYVLDRATGEFLSAEKYTLVTWASHVDPETGRPVEAPGMRYDGGQPAVTFPGFMGGHNWQPMSYSPLTGLVYIPAQQTLAVYAHDAEFDFRPGFYNTGIDWTKAMMPEDPAERAGIIDQFTGFISAWDPVAQREAWRIPLGTMWNGGMLSTAGNLIFQGNGTGRFAAYRADSGEPVWEFDAQTGIMAAPITYEVDGKQYVAVVAGWGGLGVLIGEIGKKASAMVNRSRVLVFALDAEKTLPEPRPYNRGTPNPPPLVDDPALVQQGKELYHGSCFACHGADVISSSSQMPDLRYMGAKKHELFLPITLDGVLHARGMGSYSPWVSEADAKAIHAYVIQEAHRLLGELQAQQDG
jgi:PQQ-dependent dehydrogenase (methanol/ethanol family)